MTEAEMKQWIDNASYEQLLSKWRRAAAGDPFFQRPIGDYYSEAMNKRRAEPGGNERHVAASKSIGW